MKFVDVYGRWQGKRLSQEEAAQILGVCERTFRRYCRKHEEEGAQGLYDNRLEKVAHNAAPVDEVMEMLQIFETYYAHFSVSHFYDKYRDKHRGTRSYNWVKAQLQGHGHVTKAKKRGVHRRKRERAAMPGMMLHQDGSTHEWVPGTTWDLIVTMDDATSDVYSGFFCEEEGTFSSFRGVQEVIVKHGLFCSLYTDRGSHYWLTKTANTPVDKHHLTQFGRAMQQLGIGLIPAYSPEARGRSERLFGTLQQRLPKELILAGITTMEEANAFLAKDYWPAHNARFAVAPTEEVSAFVPWVDAGLAIHDMLCIHETRTVSKDNTVSYKNRVLQIPQQQHRCHFNKATVRVHEYADGSLAIFHGPRKLVAFDGAGRTLAAEKKLAQQAQSEATAHLTHRVHKAIRAIQRSPALGTCG